MQDGAMSTNDLYRKLDNLSSIGTVIAVDAGTGKIRMQIGDNQTDWIYAPAMSAGKVKVWRLPSMGEQFAVMAQGGELCNAVPLVSLFSEQNPPPSQNADEVVIDIDGNQLVINMASGEGSFKLKKFTFDIEETIFTGTVHAAKNISSAMDVLAGTISLKNHLTSGVRSGDELSSVPVGAPAGAPQ